MAHNSTSRRRFGALGALTVSGMAAAALLGMAGTASAHTPKFAVGCDEDGSWVKVELTQYNDKDTNAVVVIIDGEAVVDEEFGKDFSENWDDLDPTVEHTVQLAVDAWDDPDASKGFSFVKEKTIEACVEPQPTAPPSSEPTLPSETPSETPSAQPAPTPSVSEVPAPTTSVEVEEAALAETGASIAIPLGIGAVLLAGGVVLMVVVRRRGRA
jgi:hypothetical protein